MHRLRDHQPDVAIETCAGVPAAARLHDVEPHRDHILFVAVFEQRREIVGKTGEAVGMIPKLLPVAGDIGIHVGAVKENGNVPVARGLRQREGFPGTSLCRIQIRSPKPAGDFLSKGRPLPRDPVPVRLRSSSREADRVSARTSRQRRAGPRLPTRQMKLPGTIEEDGPVEESLWKESPRWVTALKPKGCCDDGENEGKKRAYFKHGV